MIEFPIASIYRDGGGTYNGISESSFASTNYESIGEFTAINADVKTKIHSGGTYILDGRETFGGDCYLDLFAYTQMIPRYMYGADCATPSKQTHSGVDYYFDFAASAVFPMESKFNFMLHRTEDGFAGVGTKSQYETEEGEPRSGLSSFADGLLVAELSCHSPKTEQFTDTGLGHFDNSEFRKTVKSVNFRQLLRFPYSWIYSLSKTHGELIDNFSRFPIANKLDLEGNHGEITSNGEASDMLISFQENAFGRLPIKDRAVLGSGNTSLVIGDADFMNRIDYVSTQYGNKNQFSLTGDGRTLFWVDATNGKVCSFNGGNFQLLSDVKGLHDYIETIAQDFYKQGDIHAGYDFKNQEAYFTFVAPYTNLSAHTKTFLSETGRSASNLTKVGTTLVYNNYLGVFTSFLTAVPNMWFNFGDNFYSDRANTETTALSADAVKNVYIYNEDIECNFFGTNYDSTIEIIVNDLSQLSKVFDNLVLSVNRTGHDRLSSVVMTTESDTQTLTLSSDTRAKYREDFYRMPMRAINDPNRLRGRWVSVKLIFDNASDKDVVLNTLETKYRISRRV